jgi:hypothetical protein
MKKIILYFSILLIPIVSIAQWENDIKITNLRVDKEGYLCRYIYKTSDSLYETFIFIPIDENDIDEKLLSKISKKNGSMLYRKPLESYIFNKYMQSLNHYVIAPVYGTLTINVNFEENNRFASKLLETQIPDSVDFGKQQRLLFAATNGIFEDRIKKGIFLVYFGKQTICGTELSIIKNAYQYFNLNKSWETDVRRWTWQGIIAKYTKSLENRYLYIRYIY